MTWPAICRSGRLPHTMEGIRLYGEGDSIAIIWIALSPLTVPGTIQAFGKMSDEVEIVDDADASNGKALRWKDDAKANNPPIAEPTAWFEVEFAAEAAEYFLWIRGKADGDTGTDADWIQFDEGREKDGDQEHKGTEVPHQ